MSAVMISCAENESGMQGSNAGLSCLQSLHNNVIEKGMNLSSFSSYE